MALTALLSTTTFGIRVYYITVLLFSPREIRRKKRIQQEYFWALIALLSTTTFGNSFHDKYTTTFALLKRKVGLENPTFPGFPI